MNRSRKRDGRSLAATAGLLTVLGLVLVGCPGDEEPVAQADASDDQGATEVEDDTVEDDPSVDEDMSQVEEVSQDPPTETDPEYLTDEQVSDLADAGEDGGPVDWPSVDRDFWLTTEFDISEDFPGRSILSAGTDALLDDEIWLLQLAVAAGLQQGVAYDETIGFAGLFDADGVPNVEGAVCAANLRDQISNVLYDAGADLAEIETELVAVFEADRTVRLTGDLSIIYEAAPNGDLLGAIFVAYEHLLLTSEVEYSLPILMPGLYDLDGRLLELGDDVQLAIEEHEVDLSLSNLLLTGFIGLMDLNTGFSRFGQIWDLFDDDDLDAVFGVGCPGAIRGSAEEAIALITEGVFETFAAEWMNVILPEGPTTLTVATPADASCTVVVSETDSTVTALGSEGAGACTWDSQLYSVDDTDVAIGAFEMAWWAIARPD